MEIDISFGNAPLLTWKNANKKRQLIIIIEILLLNGKGNYLAPTQSKHKEISPSSSAINCNPVDFLLCFC